MIEEIALVTRIDSPGHFWIKRLNNSACSACMQKSSCGSASISQLLPKREFLVESPIALNTGDQVKIALDEAHLLFSSVLLYLIPLLLMLASVILGDLLLPKDLRDMTLPFLALTSLLLAFVFIHRIQSRLLLHFCFKPQVLEKTD